MPFKGILKDLVDSVPGATGAILVDWEGEAVEQFCHIDEFEMKVIGAHKGIILSKLREIHEGMGIGEVEDVVVTTGSHRHIIAPVGPDYFLVMTTGLSALQALAIRRTRIALDLLKKEIL